MNRFEDFENQMEEREERNKIVLAEENNCRGKKTYHWNVKFTKEAIMISKGKFTETVERNSKYIYITPNKYNGRCRIQAAILL